MPITGRTPAECFNQFEQHVAELTSATLGPRRHIGHGYIRKNVLILSFREAEPVAVPIETRYGRLFFYLAQELEAVDDEAGGFRLGTRRYWYRVQKEADLRAPALIRWEYDTDTPRDDYCRHYVQLAAEISRDDQRLDLDKLHVPTGWVLMEEVLRFLIVDLGMEPACGADWPEVLARGEDRFFTEFTTKRYKPPPRPS